MSTSLGTATLDLRVITGTALSSIKTFTTQALRDLERVNRAASIEIKVNAAKAVTDAQKARTDLQAQFKAALKLDVTGIDLIAQKVKSITANLRTVAGELKDAADKLKAVRTGAGTGGGGGGGGSPGISNQYAAQLRAIQGDLRAGATSTAAFEAATRALKTTIDAEIASLRSAGVLTREQQARLDALRGTSGQAAQALKQLADQQARTASRAQTDAVSQLGRELQMVTSKYQRGALGIREYLREMERIKTAGATMASGLAAGSREAQQLERVMQGLSRNTAKINDQSITKLRSDLAGARAEFERATAAAGRFNFVGQRQAASAYEANLRQLETRIRAVGERSTTTAAQMGQLNRLSAQLGSQRNALNGQFTQVGLAGNVVNALRSLPQFAQIAGGSLGAMAVQAQAAGQGFNALLGLANPVTIAIAAITVVVAGLAVALSKAIATASDFQQKLTDIRALTQPTAAELRTLTQATFDIGKPLGVGARDAAAAILELNKAGLSAKDVIGGGLKGALDLAGAASIGTAEAGKLAVGAMTAFGLQAANLPQIADVFANFANKTFLGAQDLSQAIAAVGPVARDAGIGLEQFSGLMATLAQGGFKNMSDAGTSLKTMLLSLTSPVETGAAALKAINVSAFDSAGKMRPLNDVLGDLRKKLVQLTPEAQKQLLRQIFGQDAIRAAQILLREGPKAINANTEAMRKQGEAARVARERLDTLQGAQKKFAAVMEQVKIQIGTPFLKPLQSIVEWATRGVQALLDMGTAGQIATGPLASYAAAARQAFAPLASMFQGAARTISEVWERVLKPVLVALWQIWTVIQTAVQTALGIVLQVVNGVFQAVGGIISGFVTAFFGHGKSINFTLAGMAAKVIEWAGIARIYILAVGQIAATLPTTFRAVGVGIGQILSGVVKVLGGLASAAKAVFAAAGGYALAFLRALGTFGSGVGQIVKGVAQIFGGFALAVRNAFVERVQQVFVAGARLFTTFGDGVGKLLRPAQQAFFTYIVQPAQAMGNFVRAAFDRVVTILGGAVSAAGRVLNPLGNVLSSLGIGIGEALKNAASAASNAMASFVDSGAAQANAAYAAAQKAAEAQAQAAATGVGNVVEQALDRAGNAIGDFAKDNGAGGQVTAGIKTLTGGLNTAASASGQLKTNLAATTTALTSNLAGAGQQIKAAGNDFTAGVSTVNTAIKAVGTNTSTIMAGVKKDLAAVGTQANQTAKQVQQAATVKPPSVMPSGTKTLADLGLGPKGAGGKTTAADLANQAAYKKGLKDLTDQELAAAKAEATRTNNKKAMTAILAEETRRQRENAAEAKKSATETKQAAAADQRAAEARANLVREMRQSIATFKLQADAGKVTAASQLAFNQKFEDYRTKVSKLPADLQKGTQALFDQAKALSASTNGQVNATKQVTLSGAALTKYKEALRAKSAEQLKALEADARARNLGPQLNAILAEQTRRTKVAADAAEKKAAADRKAAQEAQAHSEASATLERETRQLNERFQTQIDQGKVTAESLQTYQQALEDTKAKVEKLPEAYRAGTTALLENGAALAKSGQGIITHREEVDALRQSVDQLTYAQLQNQLATETDAEKIKILKDRIAQIKVLTDAQAEQAHAESLVSQANSNRTGLEGEFEAKKAAAQGNLAEIYRLTLEYGDKVRRAQDADADAQARRDDVAIREKFKKLLELEGISDDRRRQLEADRDRELGAIETNRVNAHAANLAAMNNAETEAKTNLDEAILGIDRFTRDQIRKNNLEALSKRTADTEAQMAEELAVEDLTEQQKLEIRKRYEPVLKAAKENEVKEARAIELQAEIDRFNDEVAATQKKLGATQAFLDAKTKLEETHRSNVAAINKKFDDDERDYGLALTREIIKAKASAQRADSSAALDEAKSTTAAQLENLDEQTAAQRKAARDVLEIWKTTYAGMGEAGKKALAEINAAIGKLDEADRKAVKLAGRLVVDPSQISGDVSSKLARIATPESASAASEAAVAKYDDLLGNLREKLKATEAALADFKNVADDSLTPDERAAKAGLEATAAAYRTGIATITTAATEAGQKAATAFTTSQADNAAESALALAEINYELAQQEGRDGGPAYLAGLKAAVAYWKGRLIGMDAGTKEYADILKKIADLEGKVRATSTNPVVERIESISRLVGTGGTLQKGIKAGLDGLAAYFKAGGSKGGSQSIIAAASALIGGLGEVFKTGDEDIDKVIDSFVGGVQATLGALAKGDWIGALVAGVTTLITTIVDIFQGGANSAKKAAQQIGEATKSIKFFDTSKYAKVVSRGGFWGWLGFKKAEIDQGALDIAQTLGDAIYSAISGGMLEGIKAGKTSFADLGIDLKKALGENILQGLIDGFMKGAIMQGVLQPFLDGYIAAMRSGNAQALAEAAKGIQDAAITANAELQNFYQNVLVPTSKQLGMFGSETQNMAAQAGSLGRNSATELGLPASVQIGLTGQTNAANQQVVAANLLNRAVERFDETIERLQQGGVGFDLLIKQPTPEIRTRVRSGALING